MYDNLYERQEGVCACGCGESLFDDSHLNSIDHYPIRREDKGTYTLDNLRLIRLDCDWRIENNAPNSKHPEVASAYRTYKYFQEERKRANNRLRAFSGLKAGLTRSPYFNADIVEEIESQLIKAQDKEKKYKNILSRMMKTHELGKIFIQAPGMSFITAAMLLDRVDITKTDSVSSLWAFFGFTPEQRAGEKGRNPGLGQLRAAFYSIPWATQALGKYEELYRKYRAKELNHGQAQYRVIKLWLSHLWVTWRKLEGLPTRSPYAIEHLPNHTYVSPTNYGWPEV